MIVNLLFKGILIVLLSIYINNIYAQNPIPRSGIRSPGWLFHAGSIAIGDSVTPGQLLRIHRTSAAPSPAFIQFTNTITGISPLPNGFFVGLYNDDGYIFNHEDADLNLGTNALVRMCVKNDGNVGIGFQTPRSLLHLHSIGGRLLQLTGASTDSLDNSGLLIGLENHNAFINLQENASLNFATNNTERLTIAADGNVGIGIDPSEKLDVNGNIRLRNNPLSGYVLTSDANGVGTWQSLPVWSGGTGISVNANIITNTSLDLPVTITGSGATMVTGTYPDFTISSTDNINDADSDPANEIQSLAINGNALSISSGNTVNIPVYQAGTGLSLNGNVFNSAWTVNGGNIYKNNYGFVGFGTSSPEKDIHIKSPAPAIRLQSYSVTGINQGSISTVWDITANSGNFFIKSAGPGGSPASSSYTAKLAILADGKIGIGTTAPAASLDINGNLRIQNLPVITTPTHLLVSDAAGNVGKKNISALADNLGNHTATKNIALGNFKLTKNGGQNDNGLIVDQYGNIGIGTAGIFQPRKKIHIHGDLTSPPTLRFECPVSFLSQNVDHVWDIVQTGGMLSFQYGSKVINGVNPGNDIQNLSAKIILDNQGNFGIGLQNQMPAARLHVEGTVCFSNLEGTNTRILTVNETGFLNAGINLEDINYWSKINTDIYRLDGNIGIGTDNPQAKLHVNGISFFEGNVGIGTNNPLTKLQVEGKSSFTDNVGIGTTDPQTRLHVEGTSFFNGNVGIGTNNPLTKFQVNGISFFDGNVGIGTNNPLVKLQVEGTSYFAGNVGMGTADPNSRLHIEGNEYISSHLNLGTNNISAKLTISAPSETGIFLETDHGSDNGYGIVCKVGSVDALNHGENTKAFSVQKGNTENFIVFGNGHVWARKIRVKGTADWSDFVFEKDYPLMTLDSLEKYISANKHLPGIPSADEIKQSGIDLAEMNALLLQKIEELTCYLIKQEKMIQQLSEKNKSER